MPRVNKAIKEEEQGYCRKCQKMLPINKFYEATNPHLDSNGHMSVCNSCCNEVYREYFNIYNDIEKSIILTCQELDVRFDKLAFEQMKSYVDGLSAKNKTSDAIFGLYKSKLTSTSKKSTGNNIFRYKDSDSLKDESQSILSQIYNVDEYDSIELECLKEKWGEGLPPTDLQWLEEKYNEWESAYEIQGKSRELVVEQLCFEELFIFRARQTGEDVSKRIKTVRDLMSEGNFSPKHESASETAEFQTLTEFIKKVEQTKPIVSDKYKDVDGMNTKWESIAGAINRTQGRSDEHTAIFEKEYAPYTIDLGNVDSGVK
jgi:hypothetical protein